MGISLEEGLQTAKLKSVGVTDGKSGGGGVMANMMDEMQKTLAKRQQKMEAKVENVFESTPSKPKDPIEDKCRTPARQKFQELANSPKLNTSASLGKLEIVSGNRGLELVRRKDNNEARSAQLETLKEEMIKEMRNEICTAKNETIDMTQ